MEVNVVNKYKRYVRDNDIYIGRGSALGNPFVISKTKSRDHVCDLYQEHLRAPTKAMKEQLKEIKAIAKQHGSVNLVCFCAPLRCHGDSIKQLLERS